VVITGVPRTGTTALHRLMAVDAAFQGLQTWLLDSPMPRPPMRRWKNIRSSRKPWRCWRRSYAAAPEKRAAHHMAAERLTNAAWCCGSRSFPICGTAAGRLLRMTLGGSARAKRRPTRHYYRCVQLIGSNEPDKRWLLKNPGHIDNLDLLFAIFPGAKVIQTHRDPAKAVPSLVRC
jgi:hypothetical protein